MNEKQTNTLTTLVKVLGILTAIQGHLSMIPEKYAVAGLIVVAGASTLKDIIGHLGDYWDDGKLNNSYKAPDTTAK